MIATLRESKANLSKLVERAAGGEEVLITVHGRPKARLVAVAAGDMDGWIEELEELHRQQPLNTDNSEIISQIREERC